MTRLRPCCRCYCFKIGLSCYSQDKEPHALPCLLLLLLLLLLSLLQDGCLLEPSLLPAAKARLEADPWPLVHAFNILRHTFNDSNLAVDTSGYFAMGIQVGGGSGLQGFSQGSEGFGASGV